MSENSVINLGDLSKPATVLIEKISDAVGGVFKPRQIRRVAQAEAEAEKIKAISKIEISQLEQRALRRFLTEEASKQANIEEITRKALPQVISTAEPQNIEKDWITNFFDKSKLISDEIMQDLWAQILASEANIPGTYSKRTINLLASLDKEDAILFSKLCNFAWIIDNEATPLIFDFANKIYSENGISFDALNHLNSIGLISFEGLAGYKRTGFKKNHTITYMDKTIILEFQKDSDNDLNIGHILLTSVGEELTTVCEKQEVAGIVEYVLSEWSKRGINASIS